MPSQANIPQRPALESYASFMNKLRVNLPEDTDHGGDQVTEDKKHSPLSTPPSLHKATTVENQGTQTEVVGEDKNKETENLIEDKGNDATTPIDRNTNQAQPNCTATSSSNV